MKQFNDFCSNLGHKYRDDYFNICFDEEYNNSKNLSKGIDKQQYIQASSEQIYYYWLKKIFASLSHDIEVNSPKDVDIYYDGEPFRLRIEVKTPIIETLDRSYDRNKIKLRQEHRYDNIPKDISPSYNEFKKCMNDIMIEINKISSITGKYAESSKTNDLKLDTFLNNANQKFLKSDKKTINILLLCLSTDTYSEYLDYIINNDTGLFSDNSYIDERVYSNVDFLVLTNCCDAHLNNNFNFNVWDATNYIHFVIPLHLTTDILVDKGNYLAKLFNDEFVDFYSNRELKYNNLHI